MPRLRVFTRSIAAIAIIALLFCVASAIRVWWLNGTILAKREREARDIVASVVELARTYDDNVKMGQLTLPEAQEAARNAIRAMRWGAASEYVGVYRWDGTTLVHANKKLEGANRLNAMDADGNRVVSLVIDLAKRGTGSIVLKTSHKLGSPPMPKIIIAESYAPWAWAIETGYFTDDIEAPLQPRHLWIGGAALFMLLSASAAERLRLTFERKEQAGPAWLGDAAS